MNAKIMVVLRLYNKMVVFNIYRHWLIYQVIAKKLLFSRLYKCRKIY